MAAEISDLTKQQQDLLKKKHARTLELRAEYIKQITNPHRHATAEGGTLFDTGIQRFQSMRITNYDHFKPNAKQFRFGALAVVVPIALYAWAMKSERDGREQKYRTGQVAYKDRRFKFI